MGAYALVHYPGHVRSALVEAFAAAVGQIADCGKEVRVLVADAHECGIVDLLYGAHEPLRRSIQQILREKAAVVRRIDRRKRSDILIAAQS